MRITQGVLINNMMRDYNRNMSRMANLNMQLSSGSRINKPSDDPAGLVTALRIRTNLHHNEQYKKNTGDAISWMEKADSSYNSLNEILQKVRELTVYGATGTHEAGAFNAIADEIEELRAEVGSIANSTLDDRYIFGGTQTMGQIYDSETNTWKGNDLPIAYEIGQNITMQVNFDGQAFGVKYENGVANLDDSVFATLDQIVADLRNGNNEGVSGHIKTMDGHINQLLSDRSKAGARVNRLEMVNNRIDELKYNYTKVLSDNEDVDLAELIMKLNNQENVFRASLAAAAKIIQPSLVDFLR